MAFKVFGVLLVLCAVQGIMSKSLKPFWGVQPVYDAAMDPELVSILSGIQMRLNQLSMITKSTIGKTVGLASKNVGTQTSGAKTNIKLLLNNLENKPNVTKECSSASDLAIDQLSTDSKNQLSTCSKTAQLQLKAMNQVQKEMSMQISAVSTETNMMMNQCKLENPLPTDTAAVTECVKTRSTALLDKISTLETDLLNTVSAVDTAVNQVVDSAKNCIQQVQEQVQQQADTIATQMEECSAAPVV